MDEKKILNVDEIRSYTLTELCEKDKTTIPTIKKGKIKDRYIRVRFYNAKAKNQMIHGGQKHPYTIRYIRVEDIEKMTDKTLIDKKSGWQK